jgi:hypothetical protein
MLSRERSAPPDFRQRTSATAQHASTSCVPRWFRERVPCRSRTPLPSRSPVRAPFVEHSVDDTLARIGCPREIVFEEPRVTVSPERPLGMHLCRGLARVTAGKAGSSIEAPRCPPSRPPAKAIESCEAPGAFHYKPVVRVSAGPPVALTVLPFQARQIRPTPSCTVPRSSR